MSDPNKVECRRPDGCDDAWRCSAGLPECGYEACDCRSYCHKAASAPTPTDYLRDAFDAWMSDGGKWPAAIKCDREGRYLLAQAQAAWTAWCAALDARRKLP
ncbi:MAG: hypothetical protein ACK5XA_07785 [Tagaea sp.]